MAAGQCRRVVALTHERGPLIEEAVGVVVAVSATPARILIRIGT